MQPGTRVLLWLNGFFRKPNFPERPTTEAYALWEYAETEAQLRELARLGFRPEGRRLLDLGCGLGGKTVYLAEHLSLGVTGLDISAHNVRAARGFAGTRPGARPEFLIASAMQLPAPDGSVDAIIATDAFEHFAEPGAVLRECARALRPGGILGVSFGPFGSPLGSHLYDRIYIPWCHLLFSRDVLAEALRELARRRATASGPAERAADLAATEEQIRYYDEAVNRMSLRRFSRIVRGTPALEVIGSSKRPPRKLRVLSPLLAVPGLDEVLTGMFSMCLRKRP